MMVTIIGTTTIIIIIEDGDRRDHAKGELVFALLLLVLTVRA